MVKRGLFITMEGGEGVGKSTNLNLLETFLRDNNIDVVTTREPGGTALGEDIRELLLRVRDDSVDPMAELLLLFAARAQHIAELIEPALAAGKWVLSDRFTDATYAYQCGGRGVDWAAVEQLENLVQGSLRPNLTLLFDAPVDVGMSRARERGELDRIEQEAGTFFERVRAGYLKRAQSDADRYRIIDASQPLADVQNQLLKYGADILAQRAPASGLQ